MAMAALILAIGASAGPVGIAAGFEDDDGNLVDDAGGGINAGIDWNSLDATLPAWTGTAPNREREGTALGWQFLGLEDAQETTSDTSFAGGTKQDDECASVIGHKANNKEDLERIYLASRTVGVNTFLMLSWVRITQNSTSNSSNIGFEFNRGTTLCAGGSGLVQRSLDNPATTGDDSDMLIVYDFDGGANSLPTLRLLRWKATGTCDAGGAASAADPCWVFALDLTAGGFAEGRVNTGATALDQLGPSDETLGIVEFGEAGINLTAAGVFGPSACVTFGKAFGVSRTSGNSANAQMKDLVGPGDFTLTNCGQIKIIKRTNPRGENQNFSFTSDINTSATATCTADTSPASFTLNDDAGTDGAANTEDCTNVGAGTYTVTEGADPIGFGFNNFSCTSSGSGTSTTPTSSTTQKNVSITLAGGGVVTCVYTNDKLTGAFKILKQSTKTGNPLVSNAGAVFSYNGSSVTDNGTGDEDSTIGEVCVSGLQLGNYTINETSPPSGYGDASQVNLSAAVVANTDCGSNQPTGTAVVTFTNPPLADIQVRFRDGGSGETSLGTALDCTNTTGTDDSSDTTGWDDTLTVTEIEAPTTITCTIDIDP
jgi:hypothetical protein